MTSILAVYYLTKGGGEGVSQRRREVAKGCSDGKVRVGGRQYPGSKMKEILGVGWHDTVVVGHWEGGGGVYGIN